jgi:methionyl-tRNA formyltransferase
MKIIVISQCTPREKIVVQEIVKNFDNVTVIMSQKGKGVPLKKENQGLGGKKPKSRSFLDQNGLRLFYKFHKESIRLKTKHIKLEGHEFTKVSIPFSEINSIKGEEFIESLQPDILFTCNAPILRGKILDIPKIAAINVHYGIAPHYRGNDTLFWAYIKKDFENLGGCLHYTTKGVDRGNILAEVFPALEPKDSLVQVDIKTSELLAKASVKILKDIEACELIPTGKEQIEIGRNYKLSEKTLIHHLKYLAKVNLGVLKPLPRKEKTVFYLQ